MEILRELWSDTVFRSLVAFTVCLGAGTVLSMLSARRWRFGFWSHAVAAVVIAVYSVNQGAVVGVVGLLISTGIITSGFDHMDIEALFRSYSKKYERAVGKLNEMGCGSVESLD